MRLVWVLIVVWLLIGAVAAGQRHYYTTSSVDCSGAGTIVATVVTALVRPWGHPFKVTAKGVASDRIVVQWGLLLPLIGAFYAAFTLDSALQHWSGKGGMWKGRAQASKAAGGGV